MAGILEFDSARFAGPRKSPLRVTKRQAEVIELRRRMPRKDVALALGVSENTVKTMQARAIEALGAESLADAVAILAERRAA